MNGIELKPDLFTIDKSKLNSKGCNPQYLNDSSGTILVINNITICQRNISDAAMGTIYNLSDNVFQSNGQYYRLSFQLNQDNMCFGSDYQDYCFERNSAIGSL